MLGCGVELAVFNATPPQAGMPATAQAGIPESPAAQMGWVEASRELLSSLLRQVVAEAR